MVRLRKMRRSPRAILSGREQGAKMRRPSASTQAQPSISPAKRIPSKPGVRHGRRTDRQWCGSKETGRIHCRKSKVAKMNILEEIAERTRERISGGGGCKASGAAS